MPPLPIDSRDSHVTCHVRCTAGGSRSGTTSEWVSMLTFHRCARCIYLDAVCCPLWTDRPMRPHAAGSCSSTAGITRTCALEKLDTREGAVAAQRAAALDPVSTAAACAFMLSLQTLATGQECGSTRGSTLLTSAPGAGEHICHVRDARAPRSWVAVALSPSAMPRVNTRARGPSSDGCAITRYGPNTC